MSHIHMSLNACREVVDLFESILFIFLKQTKQEPYSFICKSLIVIRKSFSWKFKTNVIVLPIVGIWSFTTQDNYKQCQFKIFLRSWEAQKKKAHLWCGSIMQICPRRETADWQKSKCGNQECTVSASLVPSTSFLWISVKMCHTKSNVLCGLTLSFF